jgi:hypothetical protein
MEKELTFEEIDAHIKKFDLKHYAPGGKMNFTSADAKALPTDVAKKLCEIYRVIKPILEGILKIPFIPKLWKDAIRIFMNVMASICPG